MRGPTGVVIGAGERGANAYLPLLRDEPGLARIVAVAEPDASRRTGFAERFGIAPDRCFQDHRELLSQPALADFALIATPDHEHLEPALRALERGYHVLLEKPMATREADCERLVAAAEQSGRLLQVCHVLRYAPLYQAIKRVIDSGELGDVVTIQHSENVSYWHYAHSYARGHWRSRSASSPMILAKSCHDLDLLCWFAQAAPVRLTSLERPTELCEAVAMYRDLTPILLDLKRETRPPRATDAAASTEPDDAPPKARGWTSWPVSVLGPDTSPEGIERALRESRYGRCVYRIGDNDQPSSQQVGVRFANGVVAGFSMHSTSHREGRETRIDGTRGSLVAGFYTLEQFAEVTHHKTGRSRRVALERATGLHGGADPRLFRAFLAALRGEGGVVTSARESLWSHRMAFAADRCAREARVAVWESGTA
jgi:predicted dehydrogenase